LGISVKNFLETYYYWEQLKEALELVGEPILGNRQFLVNRILQTWTKHDRNLGDLLEVLPMESLVSICEFYKLDPTGDSNILIGRIVKSGIVGSFDSYVLPPQVNDSAQVRQTIPIQKTVQYKDKLADRSNSQKNKFNLKSKYIVLGIAVTVVIGILVLKIDNIIH